MERWDGAFKRRGRDAASCSIEKGAVHVLYFSVRGIVIAGFFNKAGNCMFVPRRGRGNSGAARQHKINLL